MSDVRLRIGDTISYYPDAMVCCDSSDDEEAARRRPCLVAEILSPGTQATDRREKLAVYLAMPSVLTHLLVEPDYPMVEAHVRVTPEAPWRHDTLGLDGVVDLPGPPMTLAVSDLYRR